MFKDQKSLQTAGGSTLLLRLLFGVVLLSNRVVVLASYRTSIETLESMSCCAHVSMTLSSKVIGFEGSAKVGQGVIANQLLKFGLHDGRMQRVVWLSCPIQVFKLLGSFTS